MSRGAKVSDVAAFGSSEGKQAVIGRVIRARFIPEREAVGVRGGLSRFRLQDGLGAESEYREQRPSENACLATRKVGNGVAPIVELVETRIHIGCQISTCDANVRMLCSP